MSKSIILVNLYIPLISINFNPYMFDTDYINAIP
jgi:hypothetical protein